MVCTPFQLPDGTRGIMCGPRPRLKLCACGSGRKSTLLCDWKVKGNASGTCDAPICTACTHSPAKDKDLCPAHAAEWLARQPA